MLCCSYFNCQHYKFIYEKKQNENERKMKNVIHVLLRRGVDINIRSVIGGNTALHLSVYFNNIDAIRILLQHAVSTTIENNFEKTLTNATRRNNYKESNLLLQQNRL